ncbi:MAG: class I SAM-dependent methyltransferase [Myxococcota bacterium]|nr:class I SAM-dependent methyltransferase [Myxococcota bacterium]
MSSIWIEYEDFLYSNYPYPETHPARLWALGRLHGLRPVDPTRCRVLELGCGLGGNLTAMAVALPGSHFVGVDRSARQVAVGTELIRTLQLRNIELITADLLDFDPGPEPFDYVLCHGVYSWVPEAVQERILHLMQRSLSPDGIGYISYNTLPGWHMRGMLRDLLRRAAGEGLPAERLARARDLLTLLAETPAERSAAQAFLASEVRLLGQLGDEYLLYEHLVECNRPCYFEDFMAAAARHGLAYVTDAQCASALRGRLGENALRAAEVPGNPIATEQRLDFLEVRFFRRSLLCHAAAAHLCEPGWETLRGLLLSTNLTPLSDELDLGSESVEEFRGSGDRGISVHRPLLKAALWLLYEHRPRGLDLDTLCSEAHRLLRGRRRVSKGALAQLGESLLDLLARGFVEVSAPVPVYVTRPGPRPSTTALVRLQASRRLPGCTNLRHESVAVDDLDRCLLQRLDGSYSVKELGELLLSDTRDAGFTVEMGGHEVCDREGMTWAAARRLEQLGRSAFLLS